jgi:hypothetical protein
VKAAGSNKVRSLADRTKKKTLAVKTEDWMVSRPPYPASTELLPAAPSCSPPSCMRVAYGSPPDAWRALTGESQRLEPPPIVLGRSVTTAAARCRNFSPSGRLCPMPDAAHGCSESMSFESEWKGPWPMEFRRTTIAISFFDNL